MSLFKAFQEKISNKIVVPFTSFIGGSFLSYAPNYERFAREAFDNPFFTAPLNEIARCFNNAEIGVYKKNARGEMEAVKNSKVLDWMENPNPALSQDQYQSYWIMWYYLGGGLLMYKTPGVMRRQLYLYRPNTFTVMRDTKNLSLNGIQIGHTIIRGNELKNYKIVRAVNIDDDVAGLGTEFKSPLQSLALLGDMSKFAFTHQNRQLKNAGRRTGILEYKKLLDKRKKEEIKREFEGLGNKDAGRIAMVNGEQFKFHEMDLTPQEMDWLQSIKFLREVISATLGVPIQLISSEGTTYQNVKEFKRKIYSDVITPLLKLYCDSHTAFFKDDLNEGEFIWYDTSKIEELKLNVTQMVKELAEAFIGNGISLNEFRNIVLNITGISLAPLPAEIGDQQLLKSNLSFITDLLIDDTPENDTSTGE